ncbi:Beta-ketoacyl synthase [Lasiodiplodia theobromae]|uniref:Beta-ketoacyl synthase n=1 Tax=Lasiodiplodia theobromae TaxID=45133 RepID=UPI0015C2ED9B|nr:Beta-ketoacyl synthase [Lasiodiplodia theobromae]KAF4543916.1 Beta-ketoacyl synthase [Lasiodiplodia theobromae]
MAVSDAENARPDDVAIIGLAFRGPGDASSPENLWDLLVAGRSAFSTVPRSKWSHDGHYHPSPARGGSTSANGGHFLDTAQDGAKFDAAFFDIARSELLSMDLQQRIVLESVYEAIENAGFALDRVRGSKTSVFAAATNDDTRAILAMDPDLALEHKHTGTSNAIIANRSVVCGVNVIESPESMYAMDRSQKAQEELIKQVHASANLDLNTTAFVEAHAVGNPTADAEEAGAIASVWKDRSDPLFVGAAKANHGHLEGASGIASIIKVVLALEKGIIPQNINFEKAHPRINTEEWNIKIFTWSAKDQDGIKRYLSTYSDHLTSLSAGNRHAYLRDLAYTLAERRTRFPWSFAVAAESVEELNEAISDPSGAARLVNPPNVGFLFTGSGAQCVFDELLKSEEESRIDEPYIAQTLCTVIQIALVDLLSSWGITPTYVLGHSTGEPAAAYLGSPAGGKDATSKFDDALQSLCSALVNDDSASSKLVEIGPNSTFGTALEDAVADEPAFEKIGYQAVLLKKKHAAATLLSTVATLFADGYPVDLQRINHGDEDPELLVDLPPYPFDRTQEFWWESRRSKQWRFREWPRHDILGAPVPDWNVNEPQWRNSIRLSELPWLKDYKITGHHVLPGETFLAMAIEGVKQLVSGRGEIAGFDLRNVIISHALLLDEDQETEVMLSMRKSASGVDMSWDFAVFGYKQNTWLECCRGSVAVELAFMAGPVDAGREVAEHKKHFREVLDQCEVACHSKRDLRRQYAELERVGLEFGPLFQNLSDVKCGDLEGPVGQAIATLRVPDVASSSARSSSHNKFSADQITMWDEKSRHARVIIRGLEIGPLQEFALREAGQRQLCFNVSWKPDIDLLGEEVQNCFRESLKALEDDDPTNLKRIQDLQLAAAIYILEAVEHFDDESNRPKELAPYKQKYLDWLRMQARNYEKERMGHQTEEWEELRKDKTRRDAFLKNIEDSGPEGKLTVRMGSHIIPTLNADQDALHLMFMDSLLEEYYSHMVGTDKVHALLSAYLDLYSHKTRDLRRSTRLRKYTFTDISSGSFERAQVKFTKWREVLEFKALDIEKDLTGQGFEEVEGTYDVVLAANILHATSDLSLALENIYRLLKPGGKLIIQEFTQPDFLPGPLSFGLLPDWWRSTEPNTLNPDLHVQSIIVATTQEEERPQPDIDIRRTFVVTSGRPALREQLVADNLAAQLMTILKDACCVVTVELGNALLAGDIESEEWTAMQKLLTTANGVIWATMDPVENPKVGLSTGLLRTLRWEREQDGSCDLTTVAFEDSEKNESEMARHIRRIYRRHMVEGRDKNAEYLIRGNLVRTSRLVEASYANDFISTSCAKPVPQPQPFNADKSRALKLSIATPGQFDSLRFVDDPEFANPLPENYIEVEIKATGLNYRDVLAAKDEIPTDVLGTEGAGFVTRVGSHVTDVELGDRVIVLSAECGTFQTYSRTPRDAAIKIPEGMDFDVAAALPVAFSLAYYALVEVGRLKKGETCLIHAAAGGVGQAAIQIAKSQGADIFATVSSEEKRDLLINVYGIPKDQILSSRDLSFAKGIERLTHGRGVDVILNSLSGEALRRSWDCIAPFGRFVEIGNRDVFANANLNMEPFRRSATFAAADLHTLVKLDPKTTARVLTHVIELWQQGEVKAATPTTVYNYSQIEEAFSLLQQGGHVGKVVLTANEDDVVNVVPKARTPTKLREDASYILSGGFGGLCRSVAKSMALQGAQNLIFLSRSGASSDGAQELVEDLKRMGIRCEVFACDVSDDGALLAALRSCEESGMPKIAGVIQGATQIKDSPFESMSLEDYKAALAPKVRGSWNLHEYLPKDLDFFIMLSSSNAVMGAKNQANHASANAYQDALAHYRRARGLPATTLDLGNVFSVGSTATNRETLNPSPLFFFEDDDNGIQEQQFIALIEYHIDKQRATAPIAEPQIAVGLPCAADFRSRSVPEPAFLRTPLFMHLRSGAATGITTINADNGSDRLSVRTNSTRATMRRRRPTVSRKNTGADGDEDDKMSIRSASTWKSSTTWRSSWGRRRPGTRRTVSGGL